MGCCPNKNGGYVPLPQNALSGPNQAMLKEIEEQMKQQAAIKTVIEQSNNPNKVLIKTYH